MVEEKINKKDNVTIISSFKKAVKGFLKVSPVIFGVILLIGLFKIFVPPKLISTVFTGELFRDTFIGSIVGSISAGNPITSYIIGGELLKEGVSLFAVASFITAWVTVGIIQIPAEASILGKRFSLLRNGLGFLFSIIVAIATVLTLKVII